MFYTWDLPRKREKMVLNVSQFFFLHYVGETWHASWKRDVSFQLFLLFLDESVIKRIPEKCPAYDMPHDMLPILGWWFDMFDTWGCPCLTLTFGILLPCIFGLFGAAASGRTQNDGQKTGNTRGKTRWKNMENTSICRNVAAGFSVNVSWPQIVLGFRVFRYFGVFGTTDFCKFWNRDGLRWIWTLLNIWKQSWRTAIVIPCCLWKCQSECTGRYNICWTWPPKPPWSKCHLKQSAEWKPWSFTFCLYLRRKPFDTNLEETFNVWFSGIFMLFFVLWWSLTFLL